MPTLEEAVAWLEKNIGRAGGAPGSKSGRRQGARHSKDGKAGGYEILIINDGSTDRTVDVVLDFARDNKLHDTLRVVSLEKNRGKGGGVTHGLRHVRGEYVLFADADGASKFSDVAKLIEGCEEVVDGSHRGVAIGSRAHLVGSEAVVQVREARLHRPPSLHRPPHHLSLWLTEYDLIQTALGPAKLPHAVLPPGAHDPHPTRHVTHP